MYNRQALHVADRAGDRPFERSEEVEVTTTLTALSCRCCLQEMCHGKVECWKNIMSWIPCLRIYLKLDYYTCVN
jgi:hypothetical protein